MAKQSVAQRRWYERNKSEQILRSKIARAKRRSFVARYKSLLSCATCGMSFKGKEECCDFHHNGNKEFSVSNGIYVSIGKIKTEIRKCVPMCANCHRTLHKNMRV